MATSTDGLERLAAALAAHVGPGDRVAYRLAHRRETVALFHACGRVGAAAVPPASLAPAQVEQRREATGAVLAADDAGDGPLDLDDLPAGTAPPRGQEMGRPRPPNVGR